jgi:hypothetical protein
VAFFQLDTRCHWRSSIAIDNGIKEQVMRQLATIAATGAMLGVALLSPAPSHAAVGSNITTAVEPTSTESTPTESTPTESTPAESTSTIPVASYGCYRLGEYGYRWYPFCVGPSWLYPHHRVCRHGYCWYR